MVKFLLGNVVATPGALALLAQHSQTAAIFLDRHVSGDWGDISREDRLANDEALLYGERLLSAYVLGQDRLWVITEADRSSTCVLLPHEY